VTIRPAIEDFFKRHFAAIVVGALIAELLASPLADYHRRMGAALGLFVLSVLLLGLKQIGNRKIIRYVVLPAAGVWAIARAFEAFGDGQHLYSQLAPVAGLGLSCSILLAIFDHFKSTANAPPNAIAEAFICYLIMATAFSQIYWILNRVLDHPFNQVIPSYQSSTLLYFSMITLSGVGYGGISPVNPYIRLVASLESMGGIFFVAVVVARLVSSYRS
jgi:hypothetical protein